MDVSSLRKKAEKAGIKQGDVIVVVLLLALSAVLMCASIFGVKDGSRVRICVDGQEIAVLSLAKDTQYTVPGGLGNVVEITGGQVRMISADCPDKSCVRQGHVSRAGECIVCLPARVTVTIFSDNSLEEQLDAVAY